VLNDSGFMTTKYFYHENGSLDYVGSYNFDEDANNGAGKVSMTQASAYRYGKFIGSADLTNLQSGQPRNGDEIRAAVDYMKTNPDKWKQSLKDGAANIDSTYKASDGNTYYWNGSGWIDKDGKQVTDDVGDAISNAKKEFEEDKANKDKKWEDQDASKKENYSKVTKGVYKELTEKGKKLATEAVTNTSPFANITTIGIYANDLNNTAFINTYKATFCETQAKKNEFDKAISDMVKFSNGSSMLGQVSLTIDAVSFETESKKGQNTTTTATTNESNTTSAFAGTRTKSTKPATKTDDVVSNVTQVGKVGQQISAKLTVMDHGVQCYQLQLDGFTLRASQNQIITTHDVYEATLVTETDPVVEGQLWQPQNEQDLMNKAKELGVIPENYATQEEYEAALEDLRNGFYTNADGQSYALVEAASINIMDGKGFHAANGETFLVEVDNATKENITNNVKNSGDRSIMFMGDVRESAAGGYPTIAINTSYGGGVVQGAAAIETAKSEITQKSQVVAQAREALESGDISQSEYDSIVESAGWVGNNTEENLEKFAKGNYSWDENKTALQNIQDAFDILLNF
ncbi:MAG: hypothetical protein II816_04490, partial [Elusimicrobia bacterium]|nr:hypothetical protein [Elusimicrobiota bacterium]